MKTGDIRQKVVPSLLSGTSRQPLRVEGTALAALSLAGQALRFERPAAATEFVIEPTVSDDRRIVPECVRRPLIQLLGRRQRKDAGNDVEFALARTFSRLKLRPHPFDLPLLGPFARKAVLDLGVTAIAWSQRSSLRGATRQHFSSHPQLNSNNWTSAEPAYQTQFIAELHRNDPVAALGLIRSVWSEQDAERRMWLVNALFSSPTAEDRPFLNEARNDPAPAVRERAERLYYRVPGAKGNHPTVSAYLEHIERTTTGFLRHKAALKLLLPATVKEDKVKDWIRDNFSGASCEELARALNLTERQMIEAAADDPNLLLAFARMATHDRRLDLLPLIVERLPDAWEAMAQSGSGPAWGMSASEGSRWAETLIGPYKDEPPFSFEAWSWMHHTVRGPVPAALITAALNSAQWQEKLQKVKDDDWMELLAACCPSEKRPDLRAWLETIETSKTVTAFLLLDILDGMERG